MKPIYFLGWAFSRCFFRFYCRWQVFSPENVPLAGPAVLVSNHASFLDPLLIGAGTRRECHYLGRKSLFRFRAVAWVLERVNSVAVDRDGGGAAGLRAIFDRLQQGGAIVLFPEGSRTRTGELQPAKSGIGLIIIKSAAPVVPVRVFGTFDALARHHAFPRPRKVAVRYGEPMDFARLRLEAQTCSKARLKDIYQEVADELMKAIGSLQADAPLDTGGRHGNSPE